MASGRIKVTKIELNKDGIKELLTSDEVVNMLKGYADSARSKLGDGYEVSPYTKSKTRANVSIKTATTEAYRDNLENNSLLKAVSG